MEKRGSCGGYLHCRVGSNPTPVANAKNAQQLAMSSDKKGGFAGDISRDIRVQISPGPLFNSPGMHVKDARAEKASQTRNHFSFMSTGVE